MKACEIECLGQSYTVLTLQKAQDDGAVAEILQGERSIPVRLSYDPIADFSAELLSKKGVAEDAAASVAFYYLFVASYPLKSIDIKLDGVEYKAEIYGTSPAKIAIKMPKCKQLLTKSVLLPNSVRLDCYEVEIAERYAVYSCRDLFEADVASIGASLCRDLRTHATVIFSRTDTGHLCVASYTEPGYSHLCCTAALSAAYRVSRHLGGGGECTVRFLDDEAEIKMRSGVPWLFFSPRAVSVKNI